MKKILWGLILAALIALPLSACAAKVPPQENSGEENAAEAKISIVSTAFAQYDWIRQILGDRADSVNLTLLIDSGVDLHSYQPSIADIATISRCDMFVYVGGESDAWVEEALKAAKNKDMAVISLMDILGDRLKDEEIVEGMEHDDDHHHEHGDDHDDIRYDEHVWLSLKNARIACAHIAKELGRIDEKNAALYENNAKAYITSLDALDERYQEAVSGAKRQVLLFGDRFPFRYLLDDYGLSYYAAFSGCSAETEASFETVAFLSGKAGELRLSHVMVIDGSNMALAGTIIENTADKGQSILSLNSMQSVTRDDIAAGTTYLSIMESNLKVLNKALN